MSKGSNPRQVDKEAFDSNYDKIFGQKPITSLQSEEERDVELQKAIGEVVANILKSNDSPVIDAGLK
jgi:hypothetical protein